MEPNTDNSLQTGVPASRVGFHAGTAPASSQMQGAIPAAAQQLGVSLPQQAGDADLIEDAWVDAARRAVAANNNDPHAMSDAIAGLRQEYLRQRYGKSIETNK